MKKRKVIKQGEEEYWKSFTDILTGLLLVILLILMLLLLLLTQMNNEEHEKDYDYETYNVYDNNHDADYWQHENQKYDNDNSSSGGGGGSGVDDPGDNDNEGIYFDIGHDKTAVLVTVVDEETKNVIKKEGTLFELYAEKDAHGGLLTLHTYYPTKVEYKQYETTEAGTFYLPEKISQGWYSLHNLTAPEGYSVAKDVSFEITESLDWPEPFMVQVPMSPAKAVIYVQEVDSVTGEKIGGGSYEVFAAQDIITLDGTVRYKKGEKVDEFSCDETGAGQSIELYLGTYTVQQKSPAQFYALNRSKLNVKLEETDSDANRYSLRCEKTRATVNLTDEYSKDPIIGAVFSVSDRENLITDKGGSVTLTDLEKNTTYTLTLENLPEPYRRSFDTITVTVDNDGYIEGKTTRSITETAYMTRLSVDITDILFKVGISGYDMKLYNSDGVIAEEWETNSAAYVMEGLEPGAYELEINNNRSGRIKIDLKDIGKLQQMNKEIWTLWDTVSVVVSAAVIGLAVFLVIYFVRKNKGKRKSKTESGEK